MNILSSQLYTPLNITFFILLIMMRSIPQKKNHVHINSSLHNTEGIKQNKNYIMLRNGMHQSEVINIEIPKYFKPIHISEQLGIEHRQNSQNLQKAWQYRIHPKISKTIHEKIEPITDTINGIAGLNQNERAILLSLVTELKNYINNPSENSPDPQPYIVHVQNHFSSEIIALFASCKDNIKKIENLQDLIINPLRSRINEYIKYEKQLNDQFHKDIDNATLGKVVNGLFRRGSSMDFENEMKSKQLFKELSKNIQKLEQQMLQKRRNVQENRNQSVVNELIQNQIRRSSASDQSEMQRERPSNPNQFWEIKTHYSKDKEDQIRIQIISDHSSVSEMIRYHRQINQEKNIESTASYSNKKKEKQ